MDDKVKQEIQDSFRKIHGNLHLIPDEFCCWKNKTVKGYREELSFIKNSIIRNNLAELRICIDYHQSLYKLLRPSFTFKWQHKLVICQLIAGVYEGVLFDLFEHLSKPNEKTILGILSKEKIDRNSLSLMKLNEIFYGINVYPKSWLVYIEDLNYLRNTIHPKSLKHPKASYEKNEVVKKEVEKIIDDMNIFLSSIKAKY